jgi:PPOX class probable F420-dependent enzyme
MMRAGRRPIVSAARGAVLAGIAGVPGAVEEIMTVTIPPDLLDLLERPLFGSLGTVRPDGSVQVNPMWFEYDGETVRFTHTTTRAKYRNLQHNPAMSLLLTDPDNPLRYLEVRGALADILSDPEGGFYVRLGRRYGNPDQQPPPDRQDRVILVMNVTRVTGR